jgi:hypothetical protein
MSTLSQFLGGSSGAGDFSLEIISDNITVKGSLSSLGAWAGGGQVICTSSGTAWIVAPRCAQVGRTWANRDDAVTSAISLTSPFTGWFIPTATQLQNPGYCCRTYWDLFFSTDYWSSTEFNATHAYCVRFTNGNANYSVKTNTVCVRAFRCITY